MSGLTSEPQRTAAPLCARESLRILKRVVQSTAALARRSPAMAGLGRSMKVCEEDWTANLR